MLIQEREEIKSVYVERVAAVAHSSAVPLLKELPRESSRWFNFRIISPRCMKGDLRFVFVRSHRVSDSSAGASDLCMDT